MRGDYPLGILGSLALLGCPSGDDVDAAREVQGPSALAREGDSGDAGDSGGDSGDAAGAMVLASEPSAVISSYTGHDLGSDLSGDFDANGDGFDDVVASTAGGALVFYGAATGLASEADTTVVGDLSTEDFGDAVAALGDLDGDGFDDLAVHSPVTSYHRGKVFVFHGSASGITASSCADAVATLYGDDIGSDFGERIRGAGDVNGDGFADLLVGDPDRGSSASPSDASGRAYVFYGSGGGISASGATSADWSLVGDEASDQLGEAVSGAGDIDGDGIDDVVIGAPYAADVGQALIFHGAGAGLSASVPTDADTTLSGDTTGDRFGSVVAGGGDVNNDGYADLAAYGGAQSTPSDAVFVFLGRSGGIPDAVAASADARLTPEASSDDFGSALAFAGDVDADGFDDLLVGSSRYGGSAGRAYLFRGSSTGTASVTVAGADTVIDGDSGHRLGYAVAGAGDVDADGFADVVLGSYTHADYAGAIYVHAGSTSGIPSGEASGGALTVEGGWRAGYLGYLFAGGSDVNGDGHTDVLALAGPSLQTARLYVLNGGAGGVTTDLDEADATFELPGDTWLDSASLASAGDLDADGYDDVVVGNGGAGDFGAVYIFAGSSTGLGSEPTSTILGVDEGQFGAVMAGPGDLLGDATDDLLVTALGGDRASGVYLFQGTPSGVVETDAAAADLQITCSGDVFFASAPAGAGDLDGDGRDDLLLGSPGYPPLEGSVYVFHGAPSGLSATTCGAADTTLTSTGSRDGFGWAVSSAGDVDADGYDDVLVGAYLASGRYGGAYVHHGGVGGLETAARTSITGEDEGGSFGGAVSRAGDVNGDGYDDIAVGAVFALDTGRAYVFTGGPSGVVATGAGEAALVWAGHVDGEGLGLSVSYAGDLDADGWGDLLIGAPWASPDGALYVVSERCASTSLAYADADGDGYGNSERPASVCEVGEGLSTNGDDCDDDNPDVNPAAAEMCDELDTDENCDGAADDATATGQSSYYLDADLDGFGGATSTTSCAFGAGLSTTGDDCDDTDPDVNPSATETCDDLDVDEDCDGSADDATAAEQRNFYADNDSDGYGDGAVRLRACNAPPSTVADSSDCDDANPIINPSATETCDPFDVDENCDGSADDASATGLTAFFYDEDSDGYGGVAVSRCDPEGGMVTTGGDCDDANGSVNPSATEVCDGYDVDENCDGLADDASATGQSTYYADTDGDGFGAIAITACNRPDGHVTTSGDCDDTDPAVNPAAAETCDDADVDENCDQLADDESALGQATLHVDADGDGYGSSTTASACELTAGLVENADDCDDEDAAVHPAAEEHAGDEVDANCDGSELCWADGDLDGYRALDTVTVASSDLACDAAGEASATTPPGDCDDADPGRHPGATEIANDGIDADCDGADLRATWAASMPSETEPTPSPSSSSPPSGCACDAGAGSPLAALGVALLALRRRPAA